ncbi:hypothetical protein [Endozoicomonas arenosclerae]|uniref:H-NS family histone-like protein n=1 Tax=Endozoicomonas arenosclerae TaxID=1633495 RepID=UPI000784A0DB|nr:hypothetical protein [Endozoicomonas arenosclerae]
MNIFEESLNILKSKVQLRKLFQDMHVEDIQNVIKRVEAIHEEKLREHNELKEQEGLKREAVESILGQLQEKGLTLEDLQATATVEKVRKGKPRQRYQFQYEKEDGTVVDWEGATTGRIPAEFTEYLTRTGKERKDCIIAEL